MKKITILSVDDSKLDLFIVEKIIKNAARDLQREIDVISVLEGREAVEIAKNDTVDFVLLNPGMPSFDEIDFMTHLKSHNISIPVVFIGSSPTQNDIFKWEQLGPRMVVSKPLTSNNFIRLLDTLENDNHIDGAIEELKIRESEIGLTYIDGKIRVVKLFEDGRFELLDDLNNKYRLLYSYFSEEAQLREAIEELEYLINNPNVREVELHSFFERHPDLIINQDYKKAHSKIILESDQSEILIPDFVLEPHNSSDLCDLLELKLPNVRLYNLKKNRCRYSSAVLEACAQLREYATFFEDKSNRNKISGKYGLNIYRPRMIVVIGRSNDFEPMQIRRIQSDLPGLQLITYDDILAKAKRKTLKSKFNS